jgi:hypothetical protein
MKFSIEAVHYAIIAKRAEIAVVIVAKIIEKSLS